ncbi:hypothetical protein DRI96_04010 [Candidatus Aerophobetes bacterium]|uniref:Extracellular solute-binding protein n=2 Tax=Aerophobetes bacterium TaxID=2030807 RepID=A0A662DE33_UNCAE|nr:MAG: hypothetical protein DRI96_04010 [Candidatus Aerophobetes bacterium]
MIGPKMRRENMKGKILIKSLMVIIILALSCSYVFASVSLAREKTPIEIYNPNFKFPTEPITLTFWEIYGSRPGWLEWARKVASEYSQIHPNVKVKVREIPLKEYPIIFQSAMQTNTMADVFCMFRYRIHEWGLALPAPDWAVKIFKTQYIDAANSWQRYPEGGSRKEYQGKYLGWISSELDAGQMLYYNKDMFKEAGLDPNKPPKTSPELLEYMKKLTKYGPGGNIVRGGWAIRYLGHKGGIEEKWTAFLFWWHDCRKGRIFTEDWKHIQAWDSPDFIAAVKFYQDMVWKWKVASIEMPVPTEAFKLGLAAMTNRESFLEGILKRDAPWIHYGIAPIVYGAPPYGQYKEGVWTANQLSCVWKGTKYPQIAWDFNMFLNNDKHDLEISKIAGGIPRRKANQDTPYAKSIKWLDVFKEAYRRPLVRAEEYDPYGLFGNLEDVLGDAVVTCLLDPNADPKTELKKARAKAEEILRSAIEAQKK